MKNLSKKLSKKYSQKRVSPAKKFDTDAFKATSERTIRKTAEEISNLIGNKIASKFLNSFITKILETSSTKTYMSRKKQKITDELMLIWNMEYQKYTI